MNIHFILLSPYIIELQDIVIKGMNVYECLIDIVYASNVFNYVTLTETNSGNTCSKKPIPISNMPS